MTLQNPWVSPIAAIAMRARLHQRYVGNIPRCRFFAPDIIESVLNSRQHNALLLTSAVYALLRKCAERCAVPFFLRRCRQQHFLGWCAAPPLKRRLVALGFEPLRTIQANEIEKGPEVPFQFHIGGEGGIDSGHLGPRPTGALRASKIAPAILSNPLFHISGSNPRFVASWPTDPDRRKFAKCMAEREGFEPSKGF